MSSSKHIPGANPPSDPKKAKKSGRSKSKGKIADWACHSSSTGKDYYFNVITNESQWQKPRPWIEFEKRYGPLFKQQSSSKSNSQQQQQQQSSLTSVEDRNTSEKERERGSSSHRNVLTNGKANHLQPSTSAMRSIISHHGHGSVESSSTGVSTSGGHGSQSEGFHLGCSSYILTTATAIMNGRKPSEDAGGGKKSGGNFSLSVLKQPEPDPGSQTLPASFKNFYREDLIAHVKDLHGESLEKQANKLRGKIMTTGAIQLSKLTIELKMARNSARFLEFQACSQKKRILFLRQLILSLEESERDHSDMLE